jgi:hypothetical protein
VRVFGGVGGLAEVASVAAGAITGSVALLAFGLDSVIDGSAPAVLVWRFRLELRRAARPLTLSGRATRSGCMASGAHAGDRLSRNAVVGWAWVRMQPHSARHDVAGQICQPPVMTISVGAEPDKSLCDADRRAAR